MGWNYTKDLFGGSNTRDIKDKLTSGSVVNDITGLRHLQTTYDVARGKISFLEGGIRGFKSAAYGGLSVGMGAHLLSAEQTRSNIGELIRPDREEKAKKVPEAPSQGAGVLQARQDARRRAIESARQRFGLASTITTSPLGLVGEGAQLGNKRLLGA